jgi:hypothetical protein
MRNERQEPIKFFPTVVSFTKSMLKRIKTQSFVTDMDGRPEWIVRLLVDYTGKFPVLDALAADIAE